MIHEKSENHEFIGTAAGAGVGAAAGVGGTVAAVSSLGVTGLSGPGIVSGLAALGGGSMLGGLVVATGGTALLVSPIERYSTWRMRERCPSTENEILHPIGKALYRQNGCHGRCGIPY